MKHKPIDYDDRCMCVVSKRPDSYRRTFRQDYRLRSMVQMLPVRKGNALDVGCGGGITTESFPYYFPGIRFSGCDVSKTSIHYAQMYGSGAIQYTVMPKGVLPYKTNTFDVCIANDVLEHVPNVSELLREIRRVLKPGGFFFFVVPCEGQPYTFTWLFSKFKRLQNLTFKNFGHVHPEFTHASVLHMLQQHGFETREVRYSEHWIAQLHHICFYFIPKAIMELLFGEKKIMEYSESSLLRNPKKRFDIIGSMQTVWFIIIHMLIEFPIYWETILFGAYSRGAWKLHAVMINGKGR